MKFLKGWGLPILSILLTCLFPCGFMYFQNAGEAHVTDFLPVLGLYLGVAAGGFLLLLLILRNAGRAALLTDLGMLVLMNFTMICNGIKKLIPGFHSIIFLVLCILVLLALLVLLFRKKPDMTVPCGLVALAFGAMLLINGALALPTIVSTLTYEAPVVASPAEPEETSVAAPETSADALSEASSEAVPEDIEIPEAPTTPPVPIDKQPFVKEKRNVYFFLFDEFGGPNNLAHYYGDGNDGFFSALEDRGFSVSHTSKNPESPWTVTLIPNIMNMDYVTSDEVEIKNRLELLEDPALYRLFRENGYAIDLINHEEFLGETGCHVITRGRRGENIGDMIFEDGILSQLPGVEDKLRQDVLHQGNDAYTSLMEVCRALKESGRSRKNGPTLTVGYFIMPHAPFAADAHGNPTPEETHYEWRDNKPYWDMMTYASGVILEAVDNIQKNDPDAIIMLLADHGARKPGHIYNQYGGPEFDAAEEIPYMMNVLCCTYDPNNQVDIEGDTCINTIRKTLDAAFGTQLGTLTPPPDYQLSADDIIKDMGRGH